MRQYSPLEHGRKVVFEAPTIFYYENDYRKVEILANQVESLKKDQGHLKLNKLNIGPEELEEVIKLLNLDRVNKVLAGDYHRYIELQKNCIAFGKKKEAIIYEFENNVVECIWFLGHWTMNKPNLTNFLNVIGQKWDLSLHDVDLGITIDLKDRNAISSYLCIYDVKKLSEIDEGLELWRGTKIRLMLDERDYGTDYFDYMMVADPCDNNFFMLVNVTIGNYKEGAIYYQRLKIAGDKKAIVNKQSLKRDLGPDFEKFYLIYRFEDPLPGPRPQE